jgi:phytoene synthase
MNIEKNIFRRGSTTYYWSSKFFPRSFRDDIFKLYSFVRIVDDYVDKTEPDITAFKHMLRRWKAAKKDLANFKPQDDSTAERVLQNIVYVVHRFKCDPAWVDAFLASMQMDIDSRQYTKLEDTLEYVYGSAEIIGLFMARILDLPEEAHEFAKKQGRAMQFINFIRDIDEDNGLGRCYFPGDDLQEFGFSSLSKKEVSENQANFELFIQKQLDRYTEWQLDANKGFIYIPKRLRIALRTSVDAYNWTAKEIAKNPMIVYEKQIKPTKKRLLKTGIRRTISS